MGRPKAARVSRFCGARSASSGLSAMGILAAFALVLSVPAASSVQAAEHKAVSRPESDWTGSSASWGEPDAAVAHAPRPKVPVSTPTAVTLTAAKVTRGSSYLFFMPKKVATAVAPVKPVVKPADPSKLGTGSVQPAEKEALKSTRAYSYVYFQPKPMPKGAEAKANGSKPAPSAAKPKVKVPPPTLGKGNGLPNPNYRPYLIFQPKPKPIATSTSQTQKKTAR